MRKLNVRLIIFLDYILLMAASVEELTLARDTIIYLLQNLGFLINIKKSVLQPCQTIQFLGMEINSIDMTVTLPQEKKDQIVKQGQDLLRKSSVSPRELTQLIGRLASTAIAVLPAALQYRAMQRQQILELSVAGNYSSEIKLSDEVKAELQWWVQNLHLNNGRSVISYPPQLLIASDASLEGWGAFCQGHKTGGQWTLPEKKDHINILELRAAKYAILTFTRLYPTAKTIHIKMDNIAALPYLVKIEINYLYRSARKFGNIYWTRGSQLLQSTSQEPSTGRPTCSHEP